MLNHFRIGHDLFTVCLQIWHLSSGEDVGGVLSKPCLLVHSPARRWVSAISICWPCRCSMMGFTMYIKHAEDIQYSPGYSRPNGILSVWINKIGYQHFISLLEYDQHHQKIEVMYQDVPCDGGSKEGGSEWHFTTSPCLVLPLCDCTINCILSEVHGSWWDSVSRQVISVTLSYFLRIYGSRLHSTTSHEVNYTPLRIIKDH